MLSSYSFSQSVSNWHERTFFGLHYDLHPNARDTELGAAVTEEHIRRELEKAKPDFVQYDCKGHPGYTGYPTKIGYPSPGIVNDALKIWRKVTNDMGIPLSVHYSGTWDDVAIEHHPEWAALKADGTPHGSIICHNSDYLDKYMIPQMMEIIEEYDVDGFWVDGECWASLPCWCDRCKIKFTRLTGAKEIPLKPEDGRWHEWIAMHRNDFFEHVRKYTEAVHAKKPGCLVCSNWNYSVRVPDEISIPADYLSGDFPPSFGLEITGLEARFLESRGKTWDLMAWSFFRAGNGPWTMKPAACLKQEAAIVIMNGGSLFIYNQPERNGRLVGWHQDLLAEVAQFTRQRQDICQYSASVPQVALLHSKSHYYTNNSPLFNFGPMIQPLEGALQALLENHYHTDVLNEETLLRKINDYNFVVVPDQSNLPAEIIDRLKTYVREGGRLLVSGDFVCDSFGDVLGTGKSGEKKEGTFYIPADGGVVSYDGPVQPVNVSGGRMLVPLYTGQEPEDETADFPIATIADCGKGKIAAIHAPVFNFFARHRYPRLRSFFGTVFNAVAPEQLVTLNAPPCVDMTIRKKEDKLIVHFLNRNSAYPMNLYSGVSEEIEAAGPLALSVRMAERPKNVRLAPDTPGLRWNWENGILRAEIESLRVHNALVIE